MLSEFHNYIGVRESEKVCILKKRESQHPILSAKHVLQSIYCSVERQIFPESTGGVT